MANKEFVYNRLVGTIRWGHSMDDDWKQPFFYKAFEKIDFFFFISIPHIIIINYNINIYYC